MFVILKNKGNKTILKKKPEEKARVELALQQIRRKMRNFPSEKRRAEMNSSKNGQQNQTDVNPKKGLVKPS